MPAETADDARRDGRDIGVMAECLTFINIAEMHFDNRHVEQLQRVVNGDRRMRIGGGIDDKPGKAFARLLDDGDQLALVVALAEIDGHAKLARQLFTFKGDSAQVLESINVRFPHAEHVQVRSVQNKNIVTLFGQANLVRSYSGWGTL